MGTTNEFRLMERQKIWTRQDQASFEASRHRIDKHPEWQATMSSAGPNNPKTQDRPVPGNVGSLPPREPSAPFTHREGVHVSHKYRKSAFPMKVSAPRETQPQADTVVHGMTKVIGKEKRTDAKRWKTPKATTKTKRVRRKADKWIAKHSHLLSN